MPENLKFLLDIDNDDHYTDSLVPLRAERYIWYRLRRDEYAGNMIFLHEDANHKLGLHVCDEASAELLRKLAKPRFMGRRDAVVSPGGDAAVDSLRLRKEQLLEKLLDTAQPLALVFTYDAFAQVCRSSNQSGKRLLEHLMDSPGADRCIYVRLPSRAEELEKAIRADVSDCDVLQKAFEEFGTVCTKESMSMLDALAECLGERFLRLERCEVDTEWLLLSVSLDAPDSLEELRDQAEYLDICRMRRVGLMEPEYDIDRFTPVSIAEVRKMLRDPNFRKSLRRKVGELRSSNHAGSIRAAMGREYPLPELPPFPMYRDELFRQVMSLSFRENRSYQVTRGNALDRIKRRLTILWSTPRNPKVVELAEKLCRMTARNISNQNWDAVEACLIQLKFFAEQICVSEAYNDALEEIGVHGKYWIELVEELWHRSGHKRREGFGKVVAKGVDQIKQKKLQLIQELVESAIYDFKPAELPADAIDRKLAENYRVYQREVAECERLQEAERKNHYVLERDALSDMGEEDIPDLMGDDVVLEPLGAERHEGKDWEAPSGNDLFVSRECEANQMEEPQFPNHIATGFTDTFSLEDELD